MALSFAGTFAVYDADRLRDVTRDHASAPLRSQLIDRHGQGLEQVTLAAEIDAL